MIDNEVIDDLADAFRRQKQMHIPLGHPENQGAYRIQLRADIMATATVIEKYKPEYNLSYFYHRAGWEGALPFHENEE